MELATQLGKRETATAPAPTGSNPLALTYLKRHGIVHAEARACRKDTGPYVQNAAEPHHGFKPKMLDGSAPAKRQARRRSPMYTYPS